MLTGLGAQLRPVLVYFAPLIWVLAACAAFVIAAFTWNTIAGWVAVSLACLVVELRADMQRKSTAARRG